MVIYIERAADVDPDTVADHADAVTHLTQPRRRPTAATAAELASLAWG